MSWKSRENFNHKSSICLQEFLRNVYLFHCCYRVPVCSNINGHYAGRLGKAVQQTLELQTFPYCVVFAPNDHRLKTLINRRKPRHWYINHIRFVFILARKYSCAIPLQHGHLSICNRLYQTVPEYQNIKTYGNILFTHWNCQLFHHNLSFTWISYVPVCSITNFVYHSLTGK